MLATDLSSQEHKHHNTSVREYLHACEKFLHGLGLKRTDGLVYGLLVLSQKGMTSEEIEAQLNLSQSAVSQSLKTLHAFGAVEFWNKDGRSKQHVAVQDSLEIAASIFKRREAIMIAEFRRQAEVTLELFKNQNGEQDEMRLKRLQSIILTCQLAEIVMGFVIKLSEMPINRHYPVIIKRFKFLTEKIVSSGEEFDRWTTRIEQLGMDNLGHMAQKLKGKLGDWAQQLSKENIQ